MEQAKQYVLMDTDGKDVVVGTLVEILTVASGILGVEIRQSNTYADKVQ